MSHAAAGMNRNAKEGDDIVVAVTDIRRAYFYAKPAVDTFVELPDYFDAATRRTSCGRLLRCLYGTRPAARAWQRELEHGIEKANLKVGKMSKCAFTSECGTLAGTMHGDDVLMAGPRRVVSAVQGVLRDRYETREQLMSGRAGDPKELIILNRRVQWTDEGLRLAPDDRHLKDLVDELGLANAKHVDTPVPVTHRDMDGEELETLGAAESTLYRRLAAKLNYLSMDRPDIRFAASVIWSSAASPRVGDMVRLKRVVRFMTGHPVMWTYFRWGLVWREIQAFTDSDWASSREDRRSMSGGMLVHNGSLLRFWSRKQKAISLSSWESELYAGVTAGVEAIGLQSGLADLGCERSAVLLSGNQSTRSG